MSEIELAEFAAEAETVGVEGALEASQAASEELAETIQKEGEQTLKNDLNKLDKAIESGDLSGIKNPDLKQSAQNKLDKAKETLQTISKTFQKFNPKANFTKLKLADNFDSSIVGKDVAEANTDVMNRLDQGINKEIPDKLSVSEKFEKAAEKETDATKRERLKLLSQTLKVLAGAAVVGGLITALSGISDSLTGCYEIKIGGDLTKLNCSSDSNIRTNCTCNVYTSKAETKLTSTPDNGCIVDSSHTCPTNYQYSYKKVYWWDVLSNVAVHLQKDFTDIAGGTGAILQWFAKNWWVVLILISVPILLLIIKGFLKSE